jgi:signal transduction histidine kinase
LGYLELEIEGYEDEGVNIRARSGILRGYREPLFVAAIVTLVVGWAIVNFAVPGAGFAVLIADKLRDSVEAASALSRFFAALVLGLFLAEGTAAWRLRWVAAGLLVLGLGHLIFGYVEPMIQDEPIELNESLYESLVTGIAACAFFAIALIPRTLPRFSMRVATIVLAIGAFYQNHRGLLQNWLLFAMVFFAGAELHDYLWPSAYGSEVLTTADLLRLASALVLAVGGIGELRHIAAERTALLVTERERTQRLAELAALRADFSAMVAHELDRPIAAIRWLNEVLGVEGKDAGIREYATAAIQSEIDNLNALVADVRAAAAVERDDFEVEPRPLPLRDLLDDAKAYAHSLPGEHPVMIALSSALKGSERVWVDPKRIGQVLRNLLSNAAKYSPEGTPIELRATTSGSERIRIEVADQGPGIPPEDVARIIEKFGRGSDKERTKDPGLGLGLYLSKRIAKAHGSDLTVDFTSGEGSIFSFELKRAREEEAR